MSATTYPYTYTEREAVFVNAAQPPFLDQFLRLRYQINRLRSLFCNEVFNFQYFYSEGQGQPYSLFSSIGLTLLTFIIKFHTKTAVNNK